MNTRLRDSIRAVAVIGAGRLGRRFALECAAAGYRVFLEDVMPANLRRAEDEYQEMVLSNPSSGALFPALTVEDAVQQADIAIDFVPDELESKLEIFSLLDRMAPPRTILCTPSNTLSITDLASCVYRSERCFAIGGNLLESRSLKLFHPPVGSPAALNDTASLLRSLGREVEIQVDPEPPLLQKNLHVVTGSIPH